LLSNLSNILESAVISIPVILKLEPLIFESYIPLWEKCGLEFQLLDLDPLPEPISISEPLLGGLSHFPELVLVPVLSEFKSIIPSFHTHSGTRMLIKLTLKLFMKCEN